MSKFSKTAFTLIELLVVIAIIGILSGLIVVTMNGVTNKANIAKAQVFSNSLRNSLMLNLLSEWKLDENANDSWGNKNGTAFGSPASADCLYSKCYFFDGSDDYIDITDFQSLNNGSFTIEAWINLASMSNQKTIVSDGSGNSSTYYYIAVSSGTIVFMTYDTAPMILSGNSSLSTNNWYHVAVVWQRNAKKLIYLNGVIGGSETSNVGISGDLAGIRIGKQSDSFPNLFNGSIENVRIYDTAIPTSQIKERYYSDLNKLLINGNISKEKYVGAIR